MMSRDSSIGNSVLLFVDRRFINDSGEFGKMFVARIVLAHAFKKN